MKCHYCQQEIKEGEEYVSPYPFYHVSCPEGASAAKSAASGFGSSSGSASGASPKHGTQGDQPSSEAQPHKELKPGDGPLDLSRAVQLPVSGPERMPDETYERDVVKCPWCGHIHGDAWEFDNEGETECYKCEKPFEWTRHMTVSYTARPIKSDGDTPQRVSSGGS